MLASIFSLNIAHAASNADEISKCLSDSTTGKDRKVLARWIFSGMAQHPEISGMSNITQSDREELDKTAGQLYNRLLTQDCRSQVRVAIKSNDQAAITSAFGHLGRLAMQELTSNPNVTKAFAGVAKYVDQTKLMEMQK